MTDGAEVGAGKAAAPGTDSPAVAPDARAKHLRVGLDGAPPEVVPARMVNEVLYCERLAYLEWAQKEFADNRFTLEGRAVAHRRVDKKAEAPADPRGSAPWEARSVWLTSERLGLTAKIDIVEADGDGQVAPVEYKRGSPPRGVAEGAYLPERAQLCAQVLLLRDHGYRCEEAWLWYAKSRQKIAITIDEVLIEQTLEARRQIRRVTSRGVLPPPLEDDPRCKGCSLSGLCLPDEVHFLRGRLRSRVRRLHPSKDLRVPLYLREQGARLGVRKNLLVVKGRDGKETRVRLPNTSQVCVFGNVQISTQAVRALLSRGVPIAFFSTGGWYLGRTEHQATKNVELRVAQYRALDDERFRLRLARTLVRNKILNARTFLRRNGDGDLEVELFELKQLARKAAGAASRPSLLGLEGTAARTYFRALPRTLKGSGPIRATFDFRSRSRRPPRDPLNAALSFAYALLTKDMSLALVAAGLDPLLGYFHEPRFGRPSLALDLMEPFRTLVSDSTVVAAINNGELGPRDFVVSPVGCSMKSGGRQRLIGAYERRMAHEITHPVFGYRISYRRVLEVQARLLGRVLLGELDEYPELVTR